MPRSWPEDVVTAWMVDVTYQDEVQAGFFVGPTTLLTHLNMPPIAFEGPSITGPDGRKLRFTELFHCQSTRSFRANHWGGAGDRCQSAS